MRIQAPHLTFGSARADPAIVVWGDTERAPFWSALKTGSGDMLSLAMGVIAVACVAGSALVFRMYPTLAVTVWALTVYFVPVWIGSSAAGIYLTVHTVIMGIAVLAFVGRGFRWSWIDLVIAALAILLVITAAAGVIVVGHAQIALIGWVLPYIWGRVVLNRISLDTLTGVIASVALVAAALVVFEFVTSINIFVLTPGAESSIWGTLQERGGVLRAEGAFGHSIAMGAALAMSSVFVLTAPWRGWLKAGGLGLVAVATVVTFSRSGLAALAVTLTIAVIFLRRLVPVRMRLAVIAVGAAGAVAFAPLLRTVFTDAGDEADGSAAYRLEIFDLFGRSALIGISPARETTPTGQDYFGGYRSIDSAFVLTALQFGVVPVVILSAVLAIAAIGIVFGRGSAASVAVVGQLPVLLTAALLTQFAGLLWFFAGLAVASYKLDRSSGEALWATQSTLARARRTPTSTHPVAPANAF